MTSEDPRRALMTSFFFDPPLGKWTPAGDIGSRLPNGTTQVFASVGDPGISMLDGHSENPRVVYVTRGPDKNFHAYWQQWRPNHHQWSDPTEPPAFNQVELEDGMGVACAVNLNLGPVSPDLIPQVVGDRIGNLYFVGRYLAPHIPGYNYQDDLQCLQKSSLIVAANNRWASATKLSSFESPFGPLTCLEENVFFNLRPKIGEPKIEKQSLGVWGVNVVPKEAETFGLASGEGVSKLCALRNNDDRLEVFYAKFVNGENQLWHVWQEPGGSWPIKGTGQAKEWFTNQCLGANAVVGGAVNEDGRLEIFYVGADKNIYHNWRHEAGPSNWSGGLLVGNQNSIAVRAALIKGGTYDGKLMVVYLDNAGNLKWRSQLDGWKNEYTITSGLNQFNCLEIATLSDDKIMVFLSNNDLNVNG